MRFYIEKKITSFSELSDIMMAIHTSGKNLGFYYDALNKVRIFAQDKEDLACISGEIQEVPPTQRFIKSVRVRAAEKTERQQAKRLERFKAHLAKKGVEYNEQADRSAISAKYDYFVNVRSLSNKNSYRIYVKNKVVFDSGKEKFSSYGLSLGDSAVPLF